MRKSLNPNIPVKIIPFVALLAFSFFAALPGTSLAQPLTVTTIAGQFGVLDYTGAGAVGVGTNALFDYPGQLHADQAGNLYVCDAECIKKISPDLSVTILAGHLGTSPGTYGYLDGTGTNALFNDPTDCAIDTNGNVYVVDNRNFVIRKISPAGVVTTFAGNRHSVYTNATGTNAGFASPQGIAIDSAGNMYVSDIDQNYSNTRSIRKITPAGVVSTLAGGPYSYEGNDGIGTNAQFVSPDGLAVDAGGTVYVADEHTIRKISPDGTVTTWVGSMNNPEKDGLLTDAGFYGASEIALDRSGGLYVVDTFGPTIRYVSAAGVVSTVAGMVGEYPTNSNDGVGSDARFSSPAGIAVGIGGKVYITDMGESTVLEGNPPSLSTIGSFSESPGVTPVRSSNPWQFTAYYPAVVSDLRLRVQSTTTTNNAGSWTDLPGNPYMTDVGGNWTLNITDVPTGTRYFRVIASSPGYFDSTSAAVGPENVLDGIAPFGLFKVYFSTTPLQTGELWVFDMDESSMISDLELRVQLSNDGGNSWNDLSGGQMTRHGSTWALNSTSVPVGAISFRVVASAPTYVDRTSTVSATYHIEGSLPVVTQTNSDPGYHVLDLDANSAMQDPAAVYVQAIGDATLNLIFGGTIDQFTAALTVAGEKYLSAAVTIGPNQTLTSPGLNAHSGGAVFLQGTANGDVETSPNGVLARDANTASLIAQDGSSLIAQDGSSLIAQDGSSLIAQDGSSLIAQDGSSLIAQDGSSLIGRVTPGISFAPPVKNNGPIKPFDLTQPTFTGPMTINGNFYQFGGTLMIGIAGTNTLNDGAQQFDQLVVSGTAYLFGGGVAFELFDPNDQTDRTNVFQPADGATFDVVVASNIVASSVHIRGPVWGDGLFFKGSIVTRTDGLQAVRLTATHVPPQIFLQSAGSALRLVYGTNYTGYTIQSATSLSLSNWTAFATGTNVAMVSVTNSSRFFRLSKP